MPERIYIFDTTLRDGEQAAGTRLGSAAKLEIATQLTRLGVDVIEAGYPNSSPEDFNAVKLISEKVKGPVICALSRAVAEDIDACAKALEKAERPRIHTGIGVSDIHISGKFQHHRYGITLAEKKQRIIEMAVKAVSRARRYVDDVEFFAEDAARADRNYLCKVLEAVISAGATVVNVPDTTGFSTPDEFGALIWTVRHRVPNIRKATISVHCHNDLGMAVANTLAAVKNGAQQIEGTITGIGERAGNAALEQVVMALRTRKDYFGADCRIKSDEFYRTSRTVAKHLKVLIPSNKPVIGDNAFAHSSGIHVDGFLKQRETYEIMDPANVGFPASRVVLTARTGRHGLRHRLEQLGYNFRPEQVEQIYRRFLSVADKRQEVTDRDLASIVKSYS